MKSPAKHSVALIVSRCLLILAAVALVAVVYLASRHPASSPKPPPLAQAQPIATNSPSRPAATTPAVSAGVLANNLDFKERPFPVAYESPNFQWTLADGKDTNVIRELAHNPLEYDRMVIENRAIYRRQLVYFTQDLVSLAQQAMQTGRELVQITLPGLDGQELTVEVTRTDFRNGGRQGQIYGQLPGQPDSMVTAAFINDREAFTVNSPQNQIYLVGEAREPGEVVVKSINLALYGRPVN